MNPIFLQATNPATEEACTSTSLIDILSNMGIIGILVTVAILVLSVIAIYLFVERWMAIKKAAHIDPQFMQRIRDFVKNHNIDGAIQLCKQIDAPSARMIEKGILRIGKPVEDINAAIENVGNLEVFKLEKGLSTIATISGAAPMLGFLGTVTGMITAFYKLSVAGNNIDPGMLAGGIYEAMLTTAAGLFVGIISYLAYNILVARVQKVIFKMEANSADFMDLLQEPV